MKKIIFLGLIAGGITFGSIIFAEEGVSIGISPVSFELTGKAGEVIENYIKVGNYSSQEMLGVRMVTEDIAPSDEGGGVVVEPADTESYSLASWVSFDPVEFTLNPGEEKFVKFTIAIPGNAEPGGHYGSVLAGTKAVAGPGSTGAALVQRVGALVLLTVPGQMREMLLTKNFTAPGYSEYGPINFSIRFENQGSTHVRPTGLITITDFFGRKVIDLQFPQRNILPDSIRQYGATWNKKWLWGGKYTATLSGNYGVSNTPFSPSVITFWVFPWKIGAVALVWIMFFFLTRKRWAAAFRILVKGDKGK